MPSIATMWEKIKTHFKTLQASGTSLKKGTTQTNAISKNQIFKFITAIVVSNIFFFMLFSGEETKTTSTRPDGVEVIIEGKLMTSFEKEKEVLLTNSQSGYKIKARLLSIETNSESYLVLTSEADALKLLGRPLQWNILPYLQNYMLPSPKKLTQEIDHEIHF